MAGVGASGLKDLADAGEARMVDRAARRGEISIVDVKPIFVDDTRANNLQISRLVSCKYIYLKRGLLVKLEEIAIEGCNGCGV